MRLTSFAYGALTLSGPAFQPVPLLVILHYWRRSYNPARCVATPAVWALARSLATTCAIIVIFSSSGYLDVSVPQVRPDVLNNAGDGLTPAGFPHSDIRGSQGICPSPRLFAAYHVLRRLREPKASPMRPCSLSCSRTAQRPRAGSPVFDLARIFFRTGNHPTGQSPLSYQSFSLRSITLKLLQSSCVPNMSMSVSRNFFLGSPRQT